MRQIVQLESIKRQVDFIEQIAGSKINGINVLVATNQEAQSKTVFAEEIELSTIERSCYFSSTASPQHWYGDGEVEINSQSYEEKESENLDKVALLKLNKWKPIIDQELSKIDIYSVGKEGFQLFRLRKEVIFDKASYIEFHMKNKICFGVGFYGNHVDEPKENYLNHYSWTGELIINIGHEITGEEMTKWNLKKIYSTCM